MTVVDRPAPIPASAGAVLLRQGALPGALAGVVGGLVFGAAMVSLGVLPTVASIVRADSPIVGFVVHMGIAALVGAGFGMLVRHQRARAGELVFWGLGYGALWWFLGPQTLLPLVLGRPIAWDLPAAQALLPSLIGHLFYGATTALTLVLLRRDPAEEERPRAWTILGGVLAGLFAALVLFLAFDVLAGASLGWILPVGALLGLIYPLLFTGQSEGTGPALIRGSAYGFLWWIVLGLTLPPLLRDGELDWSPASAQEAIARLPAYVLLGAGTATFHTWMTALQRTLFVDDLRMLHEEAPGARGLRATGQGVLAGLAGGLVFTGVMVAVDALPVVARLVGADGFVVGLLTHLVIAQLIGVSYALLFRRRSFDLASGLGWGASYGFLWWVLGGLTLEPVLLGGEPGWDAAAIAGGFPSLVGHLAYGAALGVVYHRLEARANPWWVGRNEIEAERAAERQEQTAGSAPALWMLVVLLALLVPLLVT